MGVGYVPYEGWSSSHTQDYSRALIGPLPFLRFDLVRHGKCHPRFVLLAQIFVSWRVELNMASYSRSLASVFFLLIKFDGFLMEIMVGVIRQLVLDFVPFVIPLLMSNGRGASKADVSLCKAVERMVSCIASCTGGK